MAGRTASSSSHHVEALWKRQIAAERSSPARVIASPSGLSDRQQQTAAPTRALQAGGRPFEPGTAHLQSLGSRAGAAANHPERVHRLDDGPRADASLIEGC